jgi:hypothetical protein
MLCLLNALWHRNAGGPAGSSESADEDVGVPK